MSLECCTLTGGSRPPWGASGIGAGIARVLAEAGALVAVGDLDAGASAGMAHKLPGPGPNLGVQLDVTDRDIVDQAVTRIEHELGMVDVLVNHVEQLRANSARKG